MSNARYYVYSVTLKYFSIWYICSLFILLVVHVRAFPTITVIYYHNSRLNEKNAI